MSDDRIDRGPFKGWREGDAHLVIMLVIAAGLLALVAMFAAMAVLP